MREYPTHPLIGIGVIVWQQEDVLLVKRNQPPRQGQWSIPGGLQKLGETIFETAIREVLEETSVIIKPYKVITVVDAIEHDHMDRLQYHYTLIEIAATYESGVLSAADDISDSCWIPWTNIATLVEWETTIDVIHFAAHQRINNQEGSFALTYQT